MFGKFHPHVHEIPIFTGFIPMVLLVKSAMPGTAATGFNPGGHTLQTSARGFSAHRLARVNLQRLGFRQQKQVILTRKTVV